MRLLICVTALLALAAGASGGVILVDGSGGGDYLTIQAGLDAASAGDTVLVAAGTYAGAGNVDLDFGGVNKILRSEEGRAVTFIDCGTMIGSRGFYLDGGEDRTSVIEGFTIQNVMGFSLGGGMYCTSGSSPTVVACEFANGIASAGSAVFSAASSSPRFEECVFRENRNGSCAGYNMVFEGCEFYDNSGTPQPAVGGEDLTLIGCYFEDNHCSGSDGGAVHCGGVSQLEDCHFFSNSAGQGGAVHATGTMTALRCTFNVNHAETYGGAVMVSGGSLSATDCVFTGNDVWTHEFEGYGGGLYCSGAVISVENCSFDDNSARGRGGAISVYDCSGLISDCLVTGNHGTPYDGVTPRGGGIYVQLPDPDPLVIDHSTVAFNDVELGTAGGIYCLGNYGPDITRTIIAFSDGGVGVYCNGAVPVISECCVFGNAGGDTLCGTYHDNVFSDPEFCDPEGADYTVSESSPCLPANNPFGELIGARGSGCSPSSWTPGDGDYDRLALAALAPNPFSGSTTVAYRAPAGRPLTVSVFDVSGRLVTILHDGPAPARSGALTWDGRNSRGERTASGTYFVRAVSEGDVAEKKVVLVR